MTADEYDKVELPALEQLQDLGWDYLHGSALAPDTSIARSSFREPVLATRLTTEYAKITGTFSFCSFLPGSLRKTGLNPAALASGFSCSGNVRPWPN
jgi:hypothetical protein